MSKMMLTGALLIHTAVAICVGLAMSAWISSGGYAIFALMMFVVGVVLYFTLVGALGLFLVFVIGVREDDEDYV